MTVLFATNRALAAPDLRFGADPDAAGVLHWGQAEVAGDAVTVSHVSQSIPCPDWVDGLLGGESSELIVSLHGFGYSFDSSIARADSLRGWFAGAAPAIAATMVAFAWPSLGVIEASCYARDYGRASDSAAAVVSFLKQLASLIPQWRAKHPGGRVILLAHSMGNHLLHATLAAAAASGIELGAQPGLFDVALLCAGDEGDRALEHPNGLSHLFDIATRTLVLFNSFDKALILSRDLHLMDRMGRIGARDKVALRAEPVFFVDCTAIDGFAEDPEGHQYYRTVPMVRDLLACEMRGHAVWQGLEAKYRPESNDWLLMAPVVPAAAAQEDSA